MRECLRSCASPIYVCVSVCLSGGCGSGPPQHAGAGTHAEPHAACQLGEQDGQVLHRHGPQERGTLPRMHARTGARVGLHVATCLRVRPCWWGGGALPDVRSNVTRPLQLAAQGRGGVRGRDASEGGGSCIVSRWYGCVLCGKQGAYCRGGLQASRRPAQATTACRLGCMDARMTPEGRYRCQSLLLCKMAA